MATAEEWVVSRTRQPGTGNVVVVRDPPSTEGFARNAGIAALAALVGTGGAATVDHVKELYARGYMLPQFEIVPDAPRVAAGHAPAVTALASIREMLPLSVSALAKAFGVSRQALYQWQRGEGISARNEARLLTLEAAARQLSERGLAQPSILRRAIRDGRTLFELYARQPDVDPQLLVDELDQIVRRERDERARMAAILAKRKKRPINVDEISPAYPDENS